MIAPPSSQQPSRTRVESDEDSDSDWDEDDDFISKKINIRIKPVAELTSAEKISASADELRASMGTWKSMANINLVKPNSRRSLHQSSIVLNKATTESNFEPKEHHSTHINTDKDLLQPYSTIAQSSPLYESPMFNQPPEIYQLKPVSVVPLVKPEAQASRVRLPVAIATQECLHVRIGPAGDVQSSLIGHIKMAVPCSITKLSPEHLRNNDLVVQFLTSRRWSSVKGNQTFLSGIEETTEFGDDLFRTKMSLDMEAIHEYAAHLITAHNSRPYFLLPELATYTLQSRVSTQVETNYENQLINNLEETQHAHISPISATTHWLCDPSTTKVRTDIEFLLISLQKPANIEPCDVRNITVSMQVDGNVVSYQSKPQASWDPIQCRLSWSFASLQELLEASANYEVASCLAKLVLSEGPSKPSETSLQFSIIDKTLSNVQLSLPKDLDHLLTYELAKHKQEVRTGTFLCEPQV